MNKAKVLDFDIIKEGTRQMVRSVSASKDVPEPTTQRKSKLSIAKERRKRKILMRRAAVGAVALLLLFLIISGIVRLVRGGKDNGTMAAPTKETTASTETATETKTSDRYVFAIENKDSITFVNLQHMTDAWAREGGFEKRYSLTDAERYEVASVVMAEAGGECYAGKIAVAQCILQAAEDDGISVVDVLVEYAYTSKRPEPSQECLDAVGDVFDLGFVATTRPIKYFYNPALVDSPFHESQIYIMTIGGHKFYAEKKEE